MFKKTLFALCSILFASVSFASTVPQTTYVRDDNSWKFEIAPYIWAISMNGSVQTGPVRVHIDENFSDIWNQLNIAGMVWLDASKDKFDIFVNLMYAQLTDNETHGPLKATLRNNFGLFTAGVAYEVYRTPFPSLNNFSYLAFNPYIGARDTLNNTKLTLRASIFDISGSNNQNWVDPIIGLRLNWILNRAWSLTAAGDVGGVNTTTHYSYNVLGLIGYSPQTHWTNTTVYLGYRLLDQHYEHGTGLGKYNWNMKIAGPLLGLAIKF